MTSYATHARMQYTTTISYQRNRRKGTLTHLLSARCNRMHTNHICPYCFSSYPRTSSQKECFNNHIINNIMLCPPTCKRRCRTFEEWVHNHKDDDPNFTNRSLTKQQDRARLQRLIQDGSIRIDTTTTTHDYHPELEEWMTHDPTLTTIDTPHTDTLNNTTIDAALSFATTHILDCNNDCLIHKHLPRPLPRQPPGSHSPWPTLNQMEFCIKHFLKGGMSEQRMDDLLHDIHFKYTNGNVDVPLSTYDIKQYINSIPTLKVVPIPNTSKKTSVFSVKEVLSNILANDNLISSMNFDSEEHHLMHEVHHSPEWRRIINETKQIWPNSLPVILLLFYDDFRKFKMAPGSCGGLYMTILNLNAEEISKPKNIFCLGLVDSESDYIIVMKNIVSQLQELWIPHYTSIGSRGMSLVTTRLALFLADTPQRNESCSVKGHGAEVFCHQCMTCKSMGVRPDKRFLHRTVCRMRTYFGMHRMAVTKTAKEEVAKRYGIKPYENECDENPFYSLYDLYGFDIHQHSPVDLFHVGIIGLLPTTIALINEKLPPRKKDMIHTQVKRLAIGDSLNWDEHKYWNGDKWLLFMSIAPFVYSNIIDEKDDIERALHACLMRLCNCLRMMLSRRMTRNHIDQAEKEWNIWMGQMEELFPHQLDSKPNFHNCQHIFDFARRWGPPILYWARPFEHRHKTFKVHMSDGNFKNVILYSANQDSLLQAIRFIYPHYDFVTVNARDNVHIEKGIFMQYWFGCDIRYGEIVSLSHSVIHVRHLTFHSHHKLHGCATWDSIARHDVVPVPMSNYIGHLSLIRDADSRVYVNHFALLNMIKK